MEQNPASTLDLADYGWTSYFMQQLDADEYENSIICRVSEVHRASVRAIGVGFDASIAHFAPEDASETEYATVGDWLLLDAETQEPRRMLKRFSLIKRRGAGTEGKAQLIAANIDTLFIVTSCNHDFNIARLERYLTIALDGDTTPVIVLTKADIAENAQDFVSRAAGLMPGLDVVILDGRDQEQAKLLHPWCDRGKTAAFVGSSGVGKSTLVNTLTGSDQIETQGVRGGDSKGRHTTTFRALHRLNSGGWLLDTPGMRELQLADVQHGLDSVFADIAELVAGCKFHDCQHETEPGCAIRSAVADGALEPDRLQRWKKLSAEEDFNTLSAPARRAKDRSFRKMVKSATKTKK